jgi:hypothetical protein
MLSLLLKGRSVDGGFRRRAFHLRLERDLNAVVLEGQGIEDTIAALW